jgi:hypothetical protein
MLDSLYDNHNNPVIGVSATATAATPIDNKIVR